MNDKSTLNNGTMRVGTIGLCLGALLSMSVAFCTQPPVVEWTRTFAGLGEAAGFSLQQTSDGGFVAAGETFQTAGPDAIYLLKTDSLGNAEWQKTFAGAGAVVARSVRQTSDGGFVVAGMGKLVANLPPGTCVIKTDASGNLEWERVVSDSEFVDGYSVVQSGDGGFLVTGLDRLSDSGLALIKVDSLGDRQWDRRYAIPYLEYWTDDLVPIQQTLDNGYILGTKTLLKVDSLGNQQWLRTFDSLVGAYSVVQTPDRGYAATGPALAGDDRQIFLVKTDSVGNTQWTVEYARSDNSAGNGLERTEDGGYVIAGVVQTVDSRNGYLIRTSSSGAALWTTTLQCDDATCIHQTSDGGYVIAGTYYDASSNREMLCVLKLGAE